MVQGSSLAASEISLAYCFTECCVELFLHVTNVFSASRFDARDLEASWMWDAPLILHGYWCWYTYVDELLSRRQLSPGNHWASNQGTPKWRISIRPSNLFR